MATTIDGTTSSATASLQRPVISSTDPSSGSDNRAISNSRQQERQTQEAAQQRSDEAFRLDIRSQDSRAEEAREGDSANAARQTQQSQGQNRQPAQDERETSSLQVNFSANGNVNTATSPNRAGQFISLSV